MATGSWSYYYGNQVAYGSGSYFQAIIGVYDEGSNQGTTTNVSYRYSVYSRYSLSDSSNSVSWSDPWGSGSANNFGFSHGSGGGESVVGGPWTGAHGIQYGGGNTGRFTLSVSGLAGVSGTSTCTVDYPMPARSPGVPSTPTYGIRNIGTSDGWTTGVSVADAAGGTMNNIWAQWGLDTNFGLGSATTGSWTDAHFTGCPPGRVIYTRIAVGNNYYWSAWSGVVTFTTAASPPDPPVTAADTITATSARVYISSAGAENGATAQYCEYHLYKNDGNVFIGSMGAGGGIGYAGTVWSGLTRATSYRVHARTYNAAGWGGWSAGANFTTLATVPDTMAAPVVTAIGLTTATVTYTAPNNGGATIDYYGVEYANNAAFTGSTTTNGSPTTASLMNMTAATNYWVRVNCRNSVGFSTYSSATQFTTGATAPGTPAAPSLSAVTDNSAVVTWTAPAANGSPITSYDVNITATGFDVTLSSTASPLAVSGLQPKTAYQVKVRAVNLQGNGTYSTASSTTTQTGLGLNVGGTWKGNVELWMNVGGTWKYITLYVNVGGANKKIT